jgi:phosphoglycerate dehydrogenase-like enzyme
MPPLQIFCSTSFTGDALQLLQSGVAPHRLIFSQQPAGSILEQSQPEPAFALADIAFGQPDIAAILESERLRWVHLTSAGYTRYDTPEFRAAAVSQDLVVTNSSAVFAEPCAEHLLAFMLGQARQLPAVLLSRCANNSADWARLRGASRCLQNQSSVILGFGAIGKRLVEMLAPFQMKIVAIRRNPKGDEGVPTLPPEELPSALAQADHVINILPDNAASRHFFSSERFGWMKPGAIFYNIGRGTTVDQTALVERLQSGHLGAAWLDVTDPEPLPDGHPLLTAPNCFITPHTAGGHLHEDQSLVHHFLENFHRFLSRSPLQDRIM